MERKVEARLPERHPKALPRKKNFPKKECNSHEVREVRDLGGSKKTRRFYEYRDLG